MADIQLLAATSTTAPFAALRVDTQAYAQVTFACDTLTTDTIALKQVLPDGTSVPVVLPATASAIVFSSTFQTVSVPGGPTYTFAKTGTTDTAALFMSPTGRSNG